MSVMSAISITCTAPPNRMLSLASPAGESKLTTKGRPVSTQSGPQEKLRSSGRTSLPPSSFCMNVASATASPDSERDSILRDAKCNQSTTAAGRETAPATAGPSYLDRYADALQALNVSLFILILGTLTLGMLSGNVFGVVYLIAAAAWVWALYRAATAVPVNLPWLWAIGGVLPIVSYVPLLLLHNKLKKPLEAAGYRISFLGRATPPAAVAA